MSRNPVVRRLDRWSRKVHRWGAVLAAAPLLVIIGTGLMLQLKKQWAWVQPPEQRGTGGAGGAGGAARLAAEDGGEAVARERGSRHGQAEDGLPMPPNAAASSAMAHPPGDVGGPAIAWERVLEVARSVPEAHVRTWSDIDRLDVRVERGIVKVLCVNRWELQIDTATGALLHSALRRSDVIESIHDGSFFHPAAKLWVFLPAGALLLVLWGTGVYLWVRPVWAKGAGRRRRANGQAQGQPWAKRVR